MFAYCSNNPANGSDPNGFWTYSKSIGFSAVCGGGFSYSLSYSFDSHGNFAIQTSKANAFENVGGANIGLLSAGINFSVSTTALDTVYDLEDESINMGFSATVPPISAGADAIFPIDGEKPIGAAFSVGAGIGIDVHTVVPITETHFSFNLFDFIGEKFNYFKSWIKGEK